MGYREPTAQEIQTRLDELKRDICRDWKSHKTSIETLTDRQLKDTRGDMLLLYLVKRGFFDGS
jgi:hypothetical protein